MSLPRTLGELRQSPFSEDLLQTRHIKDEMRDNLAKKLRQDVPIFPGIVGYDDTVVPQIVNAILSRHNFILLGLRGQAKSRILRSLTSLLDQEMPYIASCEIHDNPYAPIAASLPRRPPSYAAFRTTVGHRDGAFGMTKLTSGPVGAGERVRCAT